MSDEVIRGILIERKRSEKKKTAIKRMAADCVAAGTLFIVIPLMLALYGQFFI